MIINKGDLLHRLWCEQWPLEPRTHLDVGAGQGEMSVFLAAMAQQQGTVFAFEENQCNWLALMQHCARGQNQSRATIAVHPLMIRRTAGIIETSNGSVRMVALDDLSFPHPVELIRISVADWELEVIAGGLQTILKHCPRMLIRVSSEPHHQQLLVLCKVYSWQAESWPDGHLFVRTAV